MKKNIRYLIVAVATEILLSSSCAVKIKTNRVIGKYKSSCVLYDTNPIVTITLKEDKTFIYERPYLEKNVSGTWELNGRTLVLASNEFLSTNQDAFTPRVKYTDAPGKDIFLVKGNKLLTIQRNSFTKDCFLYKFE